MALNLNTLATPGVYIDEADAMAHVAGFCVINDVSEREFQLDRAGSWDKGKGCDTFGPTGAWRVTRDEVADIDNLGMWLDVDGERQQTGSTSTLIFRIPHLVSCCSRFMSLQPGAVISTGTPPGVGIGRKPPRYLKGGEVVTPGIECRGDHRSPVLAASGQGAPLPSCSASLSGTPTAPLGSLVPMIMAIVAATSTVSTRHETRPGTTPGATMMIGTWLS